MLEGGWYNGQMYWQGKLHPKGFNAMTGQYVSDEVNRQSAQAQGKSFEEFNSYLGKSSGSSSNSNPAQSNPVLDFLKTSADEAAKKMDDYNKKLKDFDSANPFNADAWLTEERANTSQRLDPYYKQTLNDYLTGVETKKTRSLEDQRTLLTSLQADTDQYTGRSKMALDNALEKSREGFADSGLYSSGGAFRQQGQLTEASQNGEAEYLRKAEETESGINTKTKRGLDDLLYNRDIFKRDLNQEKSYNIEGGAQQGLSNRIGQHSFERSVAVGAPPGVDPVSYDNYSYGLLR